VPFPEIVPPQLSEYQVHCELYPKVPPENISVERDPELINTGEALADAGAVEFVKKVIVILIHVVVLHTPCALT